MDSELTAAHVSSVSTTGTLKYIKYTSEKWYIYEDTTITSYTTRNISGTATIRFNNIGQDLDGSRVDAVITVSNISVKLRWGSTFTKPVYFSVNSWGTGCNAGSWVSQSGHAISVAETVRLQFFKTGTSTLAKGTYISGITDIDVNYSNNMPESVKLYSGVNSSVYVLPAAQRALTITESNTKFTAIVNGGDNNTYKTGFVYLGNSDHTLQWTGSDCETTIFQTYYPSTITASAGTGGTITNSGAKKIGWKNTPSYTAKANTNYKIKSVTVDGTAINVPTNSKTYTYTFPAVYADHTINVQFEPIKINLSYDKNLPAATGTTTGSSNINAGSSVSIASSGFTAPHHIFTGWNTKSDGTGTKYAPGSSLIMPETNVVLYAQWTPKTYTVMETHMGGGTITPSGASTIPYGSDLNYTIEANDGYQIESITVNGSPIEITDSKKMTYLLPSVEEDIDVEVIFSKLPAMLIYNADAPSDEYSGEMSSVTAEAGDTVIVAENAFLRPEYSFIGWSTISKSEWESTEHEDGQQRPMIEPGEDVALPLDGSDMILYAAWEKNPTLTVKVSGHGTASSIALSASIDSVLGDTRDEEENIYMLQPGNAAIISWMPNDAWWTAKVIVDGEEIELRSEGNNGSVTIAASYSFENMHGDHVVEIVFSPMLDMPQTGENTQMMILCIGFMLIAASMFLYVRRA